MFMKYIVDTVQLDGKHFDKVYCKVWITFFFLLNKETNLEVIMPRQL